MSIFEFPDESFGTLMTIDAEGKEKESAVLGNSGFVAAGFP